MMLSIDKKWNWKKIIGEIRDHLIKSTTFWQSSDGVVERIDIPTPPEYKGLIGSLIVLAEREDISEAKDILRSPINKKIIAVALHGIDLREMDDHPASAAACALALLYIEEQSIQDVSEEYSVLSKNSENDKNNWKLQLEQDEDVKDRVRKGINRLDEIVRKPDLNPTIVEEMVDLAERANFKISEIPTDRDLTSLLNFDKVL